MSKFVCYTAILGGFPNKLYQPPESLLEDSHTHFVAFVDRPLGEGVNIPGRVRNGWSLDRVEPSDDPRRTARLLKVLPHRHMRSTDYSLWVDGCLTPLTPIWELVDRFLNNHDICVFEHCERGCVYKEAEACIRLKKDNPARIRAQVDRYRREGYPYNNGLGETTAVLRRHTKAMEDFNEAWWEEIRTGSCRDQLSFNYAHWKLGTDGYATFEGTRIKSPDFKWRPHR